MAIYNGCVPFTRSLVTQAPEALGEHLEGRAFGAARVTGCSWEVAADPEGRLRELVREYELAHRCLPLWNDPQRIPTD